MLSLNENKRAELWQKLAAEVENHFRQVEELPVAPKTNVAEIRSHLAPLDFEKPLAPLAALDLAVKNLTEFQVHTPHPRYFGLFNHSSKPPDSAVWEQIPCGKSKRTRVLE